MAIPVVLAYALYLLQLPSGALAKPLASSPVTTTQWNFTQIPSSKNLVWHPCYDRFFCAILNVPLDYKVDRGLQATVPLIKYPATSKPYKGMVLSNPGGPGVSGITYALAEAAKNSQWVGTNYDFVSWDPRGVGYSTPSATCQAPQLGARQLLKKLKGPEPPLDFDAQIEDAFRISDLCKTAIGGDDQAGPHMTTATVARDMISILDAFAKTKEGSSVKNPQLLNYWGISYGTFLGQTFASMFPERVGRVLVDGVVRADQSDTVKREAAVVDVDKAFSAFFEYCSAAGPKCSFSTGGTTTKVYERFTSLLAKLDPKSAGPDNAAYADTLLNALDMVRMWLYVASYDAVSGFPWVADFLVAMENLLRDGLTDDGLWGWFSETIANATIFKESDNNSQYWALGNECSDADRPIISRNNTAALVETLEVFTDRVKKKSYLGYDRMASGYIGCATWQIRSTDVFRGPFGGKTKNPILFAATTLDPITPLANAQYGVRIFDKAELLTVEAVGHTVQRMDNKCSMKKINDYFQKGKLPGNRNFCPSESGPWGVILRNLSKRTIDLRRIL